MWNGKLCIDHIFIVLATNEKYREWIKYVGLMFVDLKKHMIAYQGRDCGQHCKWEELMMT